MSNATSSAIVRLAGHPIHNWLGIPARLYVGIVWIMAAWFKIIDPNAFAFSIAAYDILPLSLINPMAIILPWLEIVTGVTIIAGLWTRASALCILGMTVMFLIALIIAITGEIEMSSCGCFAPDAEAALKMIDWDYVYRDVGYLLAALYVALFDDGRIGVSGLVRKLRRRQDVA